jgi:hypothetical protein
VADEGADLVDEEQQLLHDRAEVSRTKLSER